MFVFKLQKALDNRIESEDEAKRNFLMKKNELDQEKQRLEEIELLILETLEKYKKLKEGTLNLISLKNYENYLKKIKLERTHQEFVVKNCHEALEELKELFIEARKERKMLEKLKEKKKEVYDEELIKEEQKFMEEISNSMYNNRRNADGKRKKET